MTEPPTQEPYPSATFDTYDAFVQTAVKEYWSRSGKSHRANFIALVLASGQMMSLAKDSVVGEGGLKRAAIGAASVVALRLALKYVLSGPIGIILTGATVASLIAFFVKNQKEISLKIERYRQLIADTRPRFEDIQSGYRGNRYDAAQRNLMVDGLIKRFLADCDAA